MRSLDFRHDPVADFGGLPAIPKNPCPRRSSFRGTRRHRSRSRWTPSSHRGRGRTQSMCLGDTFHGSCPARTPEDRTDLRHRACERRDTIRDRRLYSTVRCLVGPAPAKCCRSQELRGSGPGSSCARCPKRRAQGRVLPRHAGFSRRMSASVRAAGRTRFPSGWVPLCSCNALISSMDEQTLSLYGVRELSHGLRHLRRPGAARHGCISGRRERGHGGCEQTPLYVHGEISAMESRYEARAEASGRRTRAAYRRLFGMPSRRPQSIPHFGYPRLKIWDRGQAGQMLVTAGTARATDSRQPLRWQIEPLRPQ